MLPEWWGILILPAVKKNGDNLYIHWKGAFKAVLDHGNQYASVPVGKIAAFKRTLRKFSFVLNKIQNANIG